MSKKNKTMQRLKDEEIKDINLMDNLKSNKELNMNQL